MPLSAALWLPSALPEAADSNFAALQAETAIVRQELRHGFYCGFQTATSGFGTVHHCYRSQTQRHPLSDR
jgi:hypothetical protein